MNEAEENVRLELLPAKSKKKYQQAYDTLCKWMKKKNFQEISEDALLIYFSKLYGTKEIVLLTLWTIYSFLRCTIYLYKDAQIDTYMNQEPVNDGNLSLLPC